MGRLRGGKPKFEEKYTKIKTMEVPALATTNKIESPLRLFKRSYNTTYTKIVYETTRIWEQGDNTTQKSDKIHKTVMENDSTTN